MASRLLLSACLLAALPCGAQAHAILVEGAPAAGATAAAGDVPVVFRFNSRVDAGRSRLLVTDARGDKTVLPIAADGQGDGAELRATAHLEPGEYVIRWQVLAVDGHITRGDVPFTVAAPSGGAGGTVPPAATAAAAP